ncbi:MAG: VCBS repeat-containing protein, partial [Pyrinomonadaceae bacterium]
LRAALVAAARLSQTIYVDDNAEIDLSYCAKKPTPLGCADSRAGPPPPDCSDFTLQIPPNTTLASGRGRIGSLGARLFSRTFTQCPLLEVQGQGVRISGLRFHGPDSSIENDDPIYCNREASAIAVRVRGSAPLRLATEIDNNELSSWPFSPVVITNTIGVRVHHNVIQFNRREEHNGTCAKSYGLGYGVAVRSGSATIEANVFDHNRHDIQSRGVPGASYTATYNLVLTGAVDHSFDVHGGVDREDCTNIAGSTFVIHHNTFLASSEPAVKIRGIPMNGAWIYKNETHHSLLPFAFLQINSSGNFFVSDNKVGVNKFPAWFMRFGGSSFWQWHRFETQGMSDVAAGDFDGDGAADVMRSTSTGWQWSGSGRAGWAFLNTNKEPVSQLVFGDFVGSALTDIVRATGTEWQVSDGGTSPWRTLFKTGAPLSSVAFGDFQGDGKTDAFFADGIEWTIINRYSPVVRFHIKQPFKVSELRFGNFVGDSKIDVVRSTGTEWLVWDRGSRAWSHLNKSSFPLTSLTFADFNGDGFTDIARSDDGKWFVSWGGKSRWQVLNTSDLDLKSQLIADFNGDRKADVLSRQSPDP